MENLINWLEIPAKDFKRAVSFYGTILGVDIIETEMAGAKMGLFPSDKKNVSGAIVKSQNLEPSENGVIAYLNGGEDLENVLSKVSEMNGRIIVPKTKINDEMGYFGMFIDTEGNRMAVHSRN